MTLLSQTDLKQVDFSCFELVVSIGSFDKELFNIDCPSFQELLCRKKFISLHPLCQSYEVGSEEAVAAMLVSSLLDAYALPKHEQLEELDIGYLSSESNFSEEELSSIICQMQSATKILFIVGRDIFTHHCSKNILSILACLQVLNHITFVAPHLTDSIPLDLEQLIEIQDLQDYNGAIAYEACVPATSNYLLGSSLFALSSKFSHKRRYYVEFEGRRKLEIEFLEKQDMSGVIGILQLSLRDVIQNSYPFWKIKTKEERI